MAWYRSHKSKMFVLFKMLLSKHCQFVLKYVRIISRKMLRPIADVTVETTPGPSDGPILLLMLNMLANLTTHTDMSTNSTQLFHYIIEVKSH